MALIAIATLRPTGHGGSRWTWAGEFASADALLNLMLFVPLGLSLGWQPMPARHAAGWGLLLSATIELLQFRFVPGRIASPIDLLANAAGTWLGAGLTLALAAPPARSLRVALPALVLAMGAWLGQAAVVAWAQQPSAPLSPVYYGQWAHSFPGTVSLPYRVLLAMVNERRIPDGPFATTPALRNGIERDGMHLWVQTDALTEVAGRAQLLGLSDGVGHQVANLDASSCDLVFDAHSRAARLRLHSPRVRLTSACSPGPAPTVVTASHDGRAMRLAAGRDDAPTKTARLDLSPLRGWALLLPIAVDPAGDRLGTAVWILLTAAPIGMLAALRLPRTPLVGPIVGAILLVGTAAVARLSGVEGPDVLQSAWLVAATCAGALVTPRLQRHAAELDRQGSSNLAWRGMK